MDNDGNEVNRIYAKIALRSDSNKLFSRSVGQIHIWVTFCTTHTILNIKCINSFYHLRLLLPVKHVKVTSALIQRGSCRNEISRKDKKVQRDVNLIYHPGCSDQGNSWAGKRSMPAIQLSVTFSLSLLLTWITCT